MSNASAEPERGPGSGPSRLWYLLAAVILIVGLASMGTFLCKRLSGLGDDLVQIVVPGERILALDSGSYTIFHERLSIVDGHVFSAGRIGGLGIKLASATGKPVTLTPASMSSKYEIAGRSGSAVFEFEIADSGVYLLSAVYREGADGPETVLAVGKGFGGNLLLTLLGAFAIAFIAVGLALTIGVKVFLKRMAARRASEGQIG